MLDMKATRANGSRSKWNAARGRYNCMEKENVIIYIYAYGLYLLLMLYLRIYLGEEGQN